MQPYFRNKYLHLELMFEVWISHAGEHVDICSMIFILLNIAVDNQTLRCRTLIFMLFNIYYYFWNRSLWLIFKIKLCDFIVPRRILFFYFLSPKMIYFIQLSVCLILLVISSFNFCLLCRILYKSTNWDLLLFFPPVFCFTINLKIVLSILFIYLFILFISCTLTVYRILTLNNIHIISAQYIM